jgi:AcrR family transcriptional regulator
MARTRSENYDGIHLGILTNAARLFSAQGYMRASIADLADACKLSRGALYHYFDSKEAILFAILDAHIRAMIEQVEKAVTAGGPTLTQFQNVIRAVVEVNAKSPHEQRVLIHDLSFLNEDEQQAIKDLERQLVDIVTDLLVRLDAEGKIHPRWFFYAERDLAKQRCAVHGSGWKHASRQGTGRRSRASFQTLGPGSNGIDGDVLGAGFELRTRVRGRCRNHRSPWANETLRRGGGGARTGLRTVLH